MLLASCGVEGNVDVQQQAVGQPDMTHEPPDLRGGIPFDLSGIDLSSLPGPDFGVGPPGLDMNIVPPVPDLRAGLDLSAPACGTAAQCDDGDVCTADNCDTSTHTCTHAAVTGCCKMDSECPVSASACLTPKCDVSTNVCDLQAVAGCCMSDTDCNDNNTCTTDHCNAGTCENTATVGCCTVDTDCAGSDICKLPKCAVGSHTCGSETATGCCHTDSDCTASAMCMTATCDTSRNACQETPTPGCTPMTASGKSGCGCAVGGAHANDAAPLALMLLFSSGIMVRWRRGGKHARVRSGRPDLRLRSGVGRG